MPRTKQSYREARIGEARFCIVALNDDDVNIFTTLMARNLNPGIRILARANEPPSVEKLYRAGADYVALLHGSAGRRLAGSCSPIRLRSSSISRMARWSY